MPDKPNNPYDTQVLPKLELKKPPVRKPTTHDIIMEVFEALQEKGYDPVNQLTGYILSGDPTYITSYRDARKIIGRVERDELLEEFISFYLFEPDQN
jgi:uncharacterized protein (UPF0297 family)